MESIESIIFKTSGHGFFKRFSFEYYNKQNWKEYKGLSLTSGTEKVEWCTFW